jgi:predicted acetyltransferase
VDRWLVEYRGDAYAEVAEKLKCWKTGKRLPADWVPASTFFLLGDGIFLGRVSIRHQLNDFLKTYGGHIGYYIRADERGKGYGSEILRLALDEARRLGLARVLVTCDDEGNPASARIIEKNGGILADKVQNEGQPCLTRRYWIELQ